MKAFALLAWLLVASTLNVAAGDAEAFAKSLEQTRAVIAKHHLISLVQIEALGGGKETSFRYDRYPDVEKLQVEGGPAYARKKAKGWLKSDDWAKTGTKVKRAKAEELDALVSYVDAPLNNTSISKDASQGGTVIQLMKREAKESGERLFYEMRRENSTGFLYPQFVFDKSKGAADDDALLIGCAGLMYAGDEKVK